VIRGHGDQGGAEVNVLGACNRAGRIIRGRGHFARKRGRHWRLWFGSPDVIRGVENDEGRRVAAGGKNHAPGQPGGEKTTPNPTPKKGGVAQINTSETPA